MALTWLLATYAAVGFLFSAESLSLQLYNGLIASAVCFFGIIGISSIWYLDINVFHKFWGAFFLEELRMEEKHNYLVKMGNVSLSLDTLNSRISGHENFYIFANVILIITSGFTLFFLFESLLSKLLVSLATLAMVLLIINLMKLAGKQLHKALEHISSTYK